MTATKWMDLSQSRRRIQQRNRLSERRRGKKAPEVTAAAKGNQLEKRISRRNGGEACMRQLTVLCCHMCSWRDKVNPTWQLSPLATPSSIRLSGNMAWPACLVISSTQVGTHRESAPGCRGWEEVTAEKCTQFTGPSLNNTITFCSSRPFRPRSITAQRYVRTLL